MKKLLKWISFSIGGLCLLLLLVGTAIYLTGGSKFDQKYALPDASPMIPSDTASLAHGAHLVRTLGCRECHGADLSGTQIDAMPFARIAVTNLTAGEGGIGQTYTPADWERALRHGVNKEGRGLLMMPSTMYRNLADNEVAALIAYLQTIPPVDNVHQPTTLGPIGRMAITFSPVTMPQLMAGVDVDPPDVAPAMAPTVAYGAYRAGTICTDCHGIGLRGGPHPDPAGPYSPDLLPVRNWTLEQFATALRGGVTPDGRILDPKYMPWRAFAHFTDAEVAGLYAYIRTLPNDDATGQAGL
ncbi:MAG: cytochrome c [Bacteroidetes bacterium]|nr:MAG: cytochrome c [Bacteroidota bacterium]